MIIKSEVIGAKKVEYHVGTGSHANDGGEMYLGMFYAYIDGESVASGTVLEDVQKRTRIRLRVAGEKLSLRFFDPEAGLHGEVTGTHARTGNPLVAMDGVKGSSQSLPYRACRPLTDTELEEWKRLKAASSAAYEKQAAFEKERRYDVAKVWREHKRKTEEKAIVAEGETPAGAKLVKAEPGKTCQCGAPAVVFDIADKSETGGFYCQPNGTCQK